MSDSRPDSLWRPASMFGLLVVLALVAVEGAQLAKVWEYFSDARHEWLGVKTTAEDVSVVRRNPVEHGGFFARHSLPQYTLGVRVRYTLSGAIYHTTAWGWTEPFHWLAALPQRNLISGESILVRVDPTNLGHATLLGDWTPPSTWVLGRLAGIELILVAVLLVGMRRVRRHLRPNPR